MTTRFLSGGRPVTVVAAVFSDAGSAFRAADLLRGRGAASDLAVDVVHPGDAETGDPLATRLTGRLRAALGAHGGVGLAYGLAGMGVALLGAIGLVASGGPAAGAWPWLMLPAGEMVGIGIGAGLVLVRLRSSRPDRGAVIHRVREASRRGRWAVVAHPRDLEQAQQARRQLSTAGGSVVGAP